MTLDFLERYLWEAQAHANELLEIYGAEERQEIEAFLDARWADVVPHLLDPPKAVFVFLGEDPTPQGRRLARLDQGEGRLLWLQARYQALQAAKALQLAVSAASVKGMKYRKAVRHMAEAALLFQDQPTPEELLWLQLPD